MKWDVNKQIATVIIVFIIMFFSVMIALAISNANITITYDIVMDNNTLEAIKSIEWSAIG